ncbi:hypothetical protein [Spiroplasma phoeniceum]|uniref:Spiroplasma plectrovirus-related protein n=1 Tax=Spiroplasma phoeniceum P40 TaxID=1276259 RepID=A0A345DQ84_9MOLU|nr:hypothetical protein [Spiroplasma phoeniceum]AXF96372.1 spiroplasma plectrovirus-related protein [Spiroplasma phoeniceum P40]
MNRFLVQLIEIATGKIIKDDKGNESKWDSYTFTPVIKLENGTFKGTKDLSKSKWFKITDENYLKLKPYLIDGNLFYVSLKWDGKINIVEPYTENYNEQDFINKYSNNSSITESNS